MIEGLVRRHIDGLLDDEGRRRLEQLLESDPAAREIYVRELRLHAELQVKLKGVGRPAATRRRPRFFRTSSSSATPWLAASAAAAVVLAAVAWSLRPATPPPARPTAVLPSSPPATNQAVPFVEAPPPPPAETKVPAPFVPPSPVTKQTVPFVPAPPPPPPVPAPSPAPPPTVVAAPAAIAKLDLVEGEVFLASGEVAAAGTELPKGAGLNCRAGSAELVFPDGTRVALAAHSALAGLDEKLALLERGSLSAHVAKQAPGRPQRFRTPHAEAVVLGTTLRLDVRPGATRLDVQEGKVRLVKLAGGASADVVAGHFAIAGPAVTPVSRPLPRPPLEAALLTRGTVTVNFGPEGAALPAGTLNDAGADFDPQRGHGWTGEARGTTQRTRPADVLRNTHVYAGSETRTSVWTARVPNGTYLVTLCLGDDRPQGPHHVAVQGRQVVDARATAADEYLEIRDVPATVRDGILSITLGGHRKPSVGKGGDSTLCWLQIRFAR